MPYRNADLNLPKKKPLIRLHKIVAPIIALAPAAAAIGALFAFNWKIVLFPIIGIGIIVAWIFGLHWALDYQLSKEEEDEN